ncbi:MAG: hypothetical protein KME07_08485 [Pegethrix bostrychoides GSE-TBD4-15B]|jgi:hypothetical protein|uniref:Uncharacterized protein n=1 Tax=Pegethrix bostrychoides GSE-TBD4-15B TaxID=2839662 RepID=A0A951U484_9CYAN|nr:hypothetical protein [Pegethrix bostrychoides GSE-TBD4-15B]
MATHPLDLQKAEELLAELLVEVKQQEGALAGGDAEAKTRGVTAIRRLQATKVTFGNPNQKLLRLSTEAIAKMGLELDYATQQQMSSYDFYSLTLRVNWQVEDSVAISSLSCNLDFGPKQGGSNEPIIHDIFPSAAYSSVLKVTAAAKLGFNSELKYSIGVDASQLAEFASLPGELKAKVESDNSLKAAVEIPEQTRQMGRFELTTDGIGSPGCSWRFQASKLQGLLAVEFRVIFQVPKGWDSIDLVGQAWVEPNIMVLNGELSHVIEAIPGFLSNKFGNESKAAREFAVGSQEKWMNDSRIVLPQV